MVDILIIEDNEELSKLAARILEADGYQVAVRENGEQGLSYLKENPVRLLLLDIMMDGMDGFEVCTNVRELGNMPILMMSAKSDEESKILSIELGADDYIEKPFTAAFLKAKVHALIRRNYEWKESDQTLIADEDITIDQKSRKVFKEGKEIYLPGKEFDLLCLLITHPDEVLRKEWLFDQVWGYDSESEMSSLNVHIRWIREKLEEDPKQPKYIKTVWGIGYQWNRKQEKS